MGSCRDFVVVMGVALVVCGCRSHIFPASGPSVVTVMGSGEATAELDLLDREMATFHRQHGVEVRTMIGYDTIDSRLGLFRDLFDRRSPQPDICKIDAIWPGELGDDLMDLRPFLEEELSAIDPAFLGSFTVNGRLVAVPAFIDVGVLYYRADLLRKYGYRHPPETWDELGRMAAAIERGERAVGNGSFWGFLWQGGEMEALTCNALEWQLSEGGGNLIEQDGTVRFANEPARHALERAASWVGTISPPGVVEYDEDDSQNVWQTGNAAFLRAWLDSYGASNQPRSAVAGKFGTAPLPAGAKGRSWIFGGMGFGVSQYSLHPGEAISAVRYLVSADVQRRRARELGQVPTRLDLLADNGALAGTAFTGPLGGMWREGVRWRPSAMAGKQYARASGIYAKAVHDVLTRQAPADRALADAQAKLRDLLAHHPPAIR